MVTNLATQTLGGTDQANQWLLHTSGAALPGGIQIGLGNGEDTGLVIGTNWIGIQGLAARASLTFTGNANRTFTLPVGGGALVNGSGEGVVQSSFREALGETAKITTAVVSNAATESEAVTELNFTPLAGGIYRFEYLLIAQTAAANTSLALDLTAPLTATSIVGQATQVRTDFVNNERVWAQSFSSSPIAINSFDFEAANQHSLITISGVLVMGPDASGDLLLAIRASNTAAAVSIRPGSVLTLTQLA